jgi:hypothetical protein
MATVSKPNSRLHVGLLALISGSSILAHLLTVTRYGFFRDEFYFIACSESLAWGYVDQPPLSALVLAFSRWLLGDSVVGIRLFPILAGAAIIFLTGVIARELGGGRFAQGVSALCVTVAPVFLALGHFFSMNAFDVLLWTAAIYVVIRLIKTENRKLWVVFGLILGIGLLNKISMLFLAFGLLVGLLLTQHRRELRGKWLWVGGAVAGLLFLPYLVWQANHGWPMLEFMRNAQTLKMLKLPPAQFLLEQVLLLHPLTLPIWLAGLFYLFFNWRASCFRLFGWTYLALLLLFMLQGAKPYYLAAIYPLLFAAGGVQTQRALTRVAFGWTKPAVVTLLLLGGLVLVPLSLPVLPPELLVRYLAVLQIEPTSGEKHETGKLPQHYADMFGWEEMVAEVARVYHSLPGDERAQVAIFGRNYGQAGAIDFLGERHRLPKAISGHNNYWLWGTRGYSGAVLIVIGGKQADIEQFYESVTACGSIQHEYSMPYESDLTVWVARKPKTPLASVWPRLKNFI